jgi:hypothetical protein
MSRIVLRHPLCVLINKLPLCHNNKTLLNFPTFSKQFNISSRLSYSSISQQFPTTRASLITEVAPGIKTPILIIINLVSERVNYRLYVTRRIPK